jgi:hypothetical protein
MNVVFVSTGDIFSMANIMGVSEINSFESFVGFVDYGVPNRPFFWPITAFAAVATGAALYKTKPTVSKSWLVLVFLAFVRISVTLDLSARCSKLEDACVKERESEINGEVVKSRAKVLPELNKDGFMEPPFRRWAEAKVCTVDCLRDRLSAPGAAIYRAVGTAMMVIFLYTIVRATLNMF